MAPAGVWWYGFALLTFMWVPEPPVEQDMDKLKFTEAARFAIGEVRNTLRDYRDFPNLFLYLVAYFLFIDGINTITALAGVYGATVLGIGFTGLLTAVLLVQFVAAPSAVGFTRLADRIGTKKALFISICGWVVLCFAGLAFAPLELEDHDQHDILYEWNESCSDSQYLNKTSCENPSEGNGTWTEAYTCLLYTSPSPRD